MGLLCLRVACVGWRSDLEKVGNRYFHPSVEVQDRVAFVERDGLNQTGRLLRDRDRAAVGVLRGDADGVRARGLDVARVVATIPLNLVEAGGALAHVQRA